MASVQLAAYAPLLLVAALSTAALATYTWRHREAPGATPLTGMLVGMTAWAGFYGLGLLSHSLDLRVVWLRLNWTGSAFVPMCWLLFALEYGGHTEWVNRRTAAVAGAVPVATVVFAWTSPFHNLMWTNMSVQDRGLVTLLRYDDGLWYTVFDIYTYLLIAVATALIVGMVVRHRDMYTDQAVGLLLGSFIPAFGYLAVLLGFVPAGVDLTPLTFPLTGGLFAYVIFRGNLFEALSPTAAVGQEAAVEAMQDAVVVVDDEGTIIDWNPAARDLLGEGGVVGESYADVPALADVPLEGGGRTVEVTSSTNRTLEVTVTPIRDVHDRVAGHALVLRDVTERTNYRQRLQITNRVLRHNLRNDMNVVLGSAETIARRSDDPTVTDMATRAVDAAESLTESGAKARKVEELLGNGAEPGTVDIADRVRAAVADVRSSFPEATVRTDGPDRAPGVAVDGIGAAFTEAVDNAVRHGDGTTVAVDVSLTGDCVVVDVSDEGQGIPEHELDSVVETGEESPLSHSSGTGLWLMKWLVERSGGTLSFDVTEAGTGVRMTFDRTTPAD